MGYTPFVPSFFTQKSDCDQSRHHLFSMDPQHTDAGGASFPQQCDPRAVVSGIRRQNSAGWRCRQVDILMT